MSGAGRGWGRGRNASQPKGRTNKRNVDILSLKTERSFLKFVNVAF